MDVGRCKVANVASNKCGPFSGKHVVLSARCGIDVSLTWPNNIIAQNKFGPSLATLVDVWYCYVAYLWPRSGKQERTAQVPSSDAVCGPADGVAVWPRSMPKQFCYVELIIMIEQLIGWEAVQKQALLAHGPERGSRSGRRTERIPTTMHFLFFIIWFRCSCEVPPRTSN